MEDDYIARERSIAALIGVEGKLVGLMDTIHKVGQLFQEKTDQLLAAYERISSSQTRQQKALIALTVVIALATITYTWITWKSVEAMREANEIQRQLLDLEKVRAASKTAPKATIKGMPADSGKH